MGDINLDMTKEKKFLVISYTSAAIGTVAAIVLMAPVAPLALATTALAGAVAGGIGIPTGLTGIVAVCVGVGATAKALYKSISVHKHDAAWNRQERRMALKDWKNTVG